ncbi:MAG: hypothetical protein ABWK53_10480 [Anaerolineales bacterium]
MKYFWITPDGAEIDLTQEPIILLEGMSGHLMPPFVRSEKWLGSSGVLLGLRVDARDIFLPLLVHSENSKEALRLCARYWNPKSGVGTLKVVDDGNVRLLKCQYVEGLETSRPYGANYHKLGLTLRALSPFWSTEEPQMHYFHLDEPMMFLGDPFFPLQISRGSFGGVVIVTNFGDVETYPVFTVYGPLSYLDIENLTTGKLIRFPQISLGPGDVLSINTETKQVRLNDENVFSLMSRDSSLFSLIPGSNQLCVSTVGSTTESQILLTYYPHYLVP